MGHCGLSTLVLPGLPGARVQGEGESKLWLHISALLQHISRKVAVVLLNMSR